MSGSRSSKPPRPARPEHLTHRLARALGYPAPARRAPVLRTHELAAVADQAAKAIQEKRPAEAIEPLEAALRRAPGNVQLETLLRFAEARLLAREGKIRAALEKYRQVLELCPTHRTAERDVTILRCLLLERKKPTV